MTGKGQHSQLTAFGKAHIDAFLLCLKRMRNHKFSTLLTTLVTALAFLLPALLFATLTNLKLITQQVGSGSQLQVFLNRDIDESSLHSLTQKIKNHQEIYHVDIILPAQGLTEFIAATKTKDLLNDLSDNPLEPLLLVTPKAKNFQLKELQSLKKWLSEQPGVSEVSLDNLWITRLQTAIHLLKEIFWGLVAIFSFAVMVVIASFAQTTSTQYKQQIDLLYTIGATPSYIRRPFLYSGIFIGLWASLLAILGVWIATKLLTPTAHELALRYQLNFYLDQISAKNAAIMLIIGSILGYIGSFASISLKIRKQK